MSFSHDGGDYLNYSASAWLSGDGETDAEPALCSSPRWATGDWLVPQPTAMPARACCPRRRGGPRTADDVEALRNADGGFDIEVSLVHADGVSELYLGQIKGPRIDIATDAVVRPASAKTYAAASRMYGLVDGHLLWAWDMAALGRDLASHASARLARVE